MTWTSIHVVSLFLLIGGISAYKVPKIIGGHDANVKQFPFIVSLRDLAGQHFCAGTILSDRHILTAAHCVYGENVKHFMIHSGTSRADKKGEVHKVVSKAVHPTFQEREGVDGSDDIAVLTLEKPIIFNKYQQKINLASHDVQDYEVGYLVGWGRISTENWEAAVQLQKLQMALIPSEKCKPFLLSDIDETYLCGFRTTGKGGCHGDSGGPLISHGEIVGIVSRGDIGSNCADGSPNIFTNVFAFKNFIESAMKN